LARLLLLSNSTLPGTPYLQWARPEIDRFLNQTRSMLFIPYAAVGFSYDHYTDMVKKGLDGTGIQVSSIHEHDNKIEAVNQAEAIAVGGGNTFQLLKLLQEQGLVTAIRERAEAGTPYIGWSAGSNVCGPSIKTTNDMPITQPPSFDAIGLFPLQLNPHYTEKTIEGHGGESRKQRLKEYIAINTTPVICLPEGTAVEEDNGSYSLVGNENALILSPSGERTIEPGHFEL